VRALVPDKGKLDHIDFVAFELIKDNAPATKMEQLAFLKENHFDVVQHEAVSAGDGVERMTELLQTWTPDGFKYPVDGVVIEYDDIAYGKSLGATAHHEKRMLALKWQDEMKTTIFRGVELNTTRTGAVSIVAKFDEVILDGTRIHRANMHNLGNFESYKLGVGDMIRVYKANMIVPQVADNLTRSGTYELPRHCPCCGTELTVRITSGGVKELYCPNENCIARNARKIARFCDKNAMNIEGFSASVVENLMAYGWIKGYKDLYQLHLHEEEIINTPGFGPEKYLAMEQAIEKSRKCMMRQFLVGIGIPLMGSEAAKILHQYYYGSMDDFEEALRSGFPFSHIAGISEALERSIHTWYEDPMNQKTLHALMAELTFKGTRASGDGTNPFRDMQVVVTGTFNNFDRSELLELLESLGAITDNTVSAGTDYLIYGAMPGSKKVGAALEHGVNMISEKTFAEMLQQNR
jgi:DNA ligase (NAD+)